ncbi:MAG: replicative DNA helicase [Candidatus Marinimicrobia bacterium]|jgi:replicative DNA helicase|nr:replicative DNA helicase [Candidatus Neomarinimicrobiota bacterium]MDD5231572.1 replicative DNA helicase [Candidatus Neomarinimicrobiota bacterium]
MAQSDGEITRVPPHSDEAEVSVLGAMMLDKEAVSKALQYLDHTAFYKEAHQHIFHAMTDLFNEGQPVDQVSVIDQLKRKKMLEIVGGAYYVTGLVEATPSAANIEHYAKIVLDTAIFRRLIVASNEIQSMAYEARETAFEVLDTAEQKIFALSENRLRGGFKNFVDVLNRTFEHIDSIHSRKGHTTGVPSGLLDLDDLTSGFHPGELIILAGRPGMGKTALALTIARNAAVEYNLPVGFFSIEMADYQLALRILCAEARLDSHLVRTGKLPKDQWQRLSMQTGRLSNAKMYIDDSPVLTMMDIRAKARRAKAEHDIQMVIIDYLQLIKGHRAENRQQEITEISRGLKALSKEIGVPVIALSQLSRAVEGRTDHRPQLSDLRESGSLEQDADVVLFIYRKSFYEKRDGSAPPEEDERIAEIMVAKQRNGPTGNIEVIFIDKYTRFENKRSQREEIITTPF